MRVIQILSLRYTSSTRRTMSPIYLRQSTVHLELHSSPGQRNSNASLVGTEWRNYLWRTLEYSKCPSAACFPARAPRWSFFTALRNLQQRSTADSVRDVIYPRLIWELVHVDHRLFRFQRYRTTPRVGFWLMALRLREPVRFQTKRPRFEPPPRSSASFQRFPLVSFFFFLSFFLCRLSSVSLSRVSHNAGRLCYDGCNVKYETLHRRCRVDKVEGEQARPRASGRGYCPGNPCFQPFLRAVSSREIRAQAGISRRCINEFDRRPRRSPGVQELISATLSLRFTDFSKRQRSYA